MRRLPLGGLGIFPSMLFLAFGGKAISFLGRICLQLTGLSPLSAQHSG